MTYIENHDHSTIVREAGGRDRWFKTQPPAIALLTSPGIVLLHNGQEFGEDYFIPSEGADRVKPRPLRWSSHSQGRGCVSPLRPAADGQVERFIIVINYSDFEQFVDIPFSVNGRWDDLLNEQSAVIENFRLFNQQINSNWGRIYFKKG